MCLNPFQHIAIATAVLGVWFNLEPAFGEEWPLPAWNTVSASDAGLVESRLEEARDYALTGGGSGYITRGGKLVLAWGDPKHRYDLKSSTKSFGATALGMAILDGKIALTDKVARHYPEFGSQPESNLQTGWLDRITIFHLATHTAGFGKRGGYEALMFDPGTKWSYSDGGPNWLADCVTLAYKADIDSLMFDRVFTPIGILREDLVWRKNQYREKKIAGIERREFGSGISANVDAMARVGLLYLRRGLWEGKRILPADFVELASHPFTAIVGRPVLDSDHYGDASNHYGLLWWNNADGTLKKVPRDAFWSWGLGDSLIVVIPSLDIVVARAGQSWKRANDSHYEVLRPFLEPIATAVEDDLLERKTSTSTPPGAESRPATRAPYPASSVISDIEWSPPSTIIRRARGGDNWPMTWGDDDRLYTAYGDGKGFEPHIDIKLSMGLAIIDGTPNQFTTANLRSPSFETRGDGPRGKKASGMLMVDGILYVWARNADNSQLGWSSDRGNTWTWSDWKMTESFGCPTFLNFGRNYSGARDDYVYVYSHDSQSAYEPADHMVLARVDRHRMQQQDAYEYFAGMASDDSPIWSSDIAARTSVFSNPKRCYRNGISYNPGLKRYLWCQILPGPDTRFHGGFAIYDGPQPWGPWTTAFYNEAWDVGPGESSHIPTKWISDDGRTVYLVFSGEDHFSLRRATIRVKSETK